MKRSDHQGSGVAGVLCACLFLLSACGGSSGSSSPPPATSTSPDTNTKAEWNNSDWNEGEWQ